MLEIGGVKQSEEYCPTENSTLRNRTICVRARKHDRLAGTQFPI